MTVLTRKAERAGGQVIAFRTRTTALSQRCLCGEKHPKRLAERVHPCPHGAVTMQRDLFSAYLARLVEDEASESPRRARRGQVRNRSCGRLGNGQRQTNLRVGGRRRPPLAAILAVRVRVGRPSKTSGPRITQRMVYLPRKRERAPLSV